MPISRRTRQELKKYEKKVHVPYFDDKKSINYFKQHFYLIKKVYLKGTEISCYRCGNKHVSNGEFIGYPACSKCSEIILTQRRENDREQSRLREKRNNIEMYIGSMEKLLASSGYQEESPIIRGTLKTIVFDLCFS